MTTTTPKLLTRDEIRQRLEASQHKALARHGKREQIYFCVTQLLREKDGNRFDARITNLPTEKIHACFPNVKATMIGDRMHVGLVEDGYVVEEYFEFLFRKEGTQFSFARWSQQNSPPQSPPNVFTEDYDEVATLLHAAIIADRELYQACPQTHPLFGKMRRIREMKGIENSPVAG